MRLPVLQCLLLLFLLSTLVIQTKADVSSIDNNMFDKAALENALTQQLQNTGESDLQIAAQNPLSADWNIYPIKTDGLTPGALQQIVAGRTHIIALTDQGLYGCGINRHGQLGLGHTNRCTSWTRLDNLSGTPLQIATSGYHSIALTDQGLYVCGENVYGQLGLVHMDKCTSWTRVDSLPGMPLKIVASQNRTIVLTDRGLYVCGYNEHGQLGLGHSNKCTN